MMFFRSIKFQLGLIAFLFIVFVALVLFQMYFTEKMQREELEHQRKSHLVIKDYMALEEMEWDVLESIRILTKNLDEKTPQVASKISDIDSEIQAWFGRLNEWKKEISPKGAKDSWRRQSHFTIPNTVFDQSFLDNKTENKKNYEKILKLCREKKYDEARRLFSIEVNFLPRANDTILAVLKGISAQIQIDLDFAKSFYKTTAIALLLALFAIVFVAGSIAMKLTGSLKELEKGAYRISNGNFETKTVVRSFLELQSLARSFNDMQDAIKSRDERIREDHEQIQQLNEILEQKVEERNRTIVNQNESLKRKNEELEQILYAASHDLRTPLISIQGFSEELKMACSNLQNSLKADSPDMGSVNQIVNDEVVLALNYIINGSKRMEVLLQGLLRLSRMGRESLKIQEIDMNELLRNVADTLSFQLNEADAELKIEDLCNCYGDPSQIEQVFFNLINNAIKYRDPKRKSVVRVFSGKKDGFSSYSVQDNGIGIPKENLERVFHAFYRIDEENGEGEGIGLAIVNRAIDLHNGRIAVKSEPGEGSTFTLEIPEPEKED